MSFILIIDLSLGPPARCRYPWLVIQNLVDIVIFVYVLQLLVIILGWSSRSSSVVVIFVLVLQILVIFVLVLQILVVIQIISPIIVCSCCVTSPLQVLPPGPGANTFSCNGRICI